VCARVPLRERGALLLLRIPDLIASCAQIHIFQVGIIISHINNLVVRFVLPIGCRPCACACVRPLIARTFIIRTTNRMNPRQCRVILCVFIHHLRKGLWRGCVFHIHFADTDIIRRDCIVYISAISTVILKFVFRCDTDIIHIVTYRAEMHRRS
jgi:hypothetical protein